MKEKTIDLSKELSENDTKLLVLLLKQHPDVPKFKKGFTVNMVGKHERTYELDLGDGKKTNLRLSNSLLRFKDTDGIVKYAVIGNTQEDTLGRGKFGTAKKSYKAIFIGESEELLSSDVVLRVIKTQLLKAKKEMEKTDIVRKSLNMKRLERKTNRTNEDETILQSIIRSLKTETSSERLAEVSKIEHEALVTWHLKKGVKDIVVREDKENKESSDKAHIITSFIDGCTADKWIESLCSENYALNESRIDVLFKTFLTVISKLDDLHKENVIHNDTHFGNFLVNYDENNSVVKGEFIDFGKSLFQYEITLLQLEPEYNSFKNDMRYLVSVCYDELRKILLSALSKEDSKIFTEQELVCLKEAQDLFYDVSVNPLKYTLPEIQDKLELIQSKLHHKLDLNLVENPLSEKAFDSAKEITQHTEQLLGRTVERSEKPELSNSMMFFCKQKSSSGNETTLEESDPANTNRSSTITHAFGKKD